MDSLYGEEEESLRHFRQGQCHSKFTLVFFCRLSEVMLVCESQ